jgi:hypothetical protein
MYISVSNIFSKSIQYLFSHIMFYELCVKILTYKEELAGLSLQHAEA